MSCCQTVQKEDGSCVEDLTSKTEADSVPKKVEGPLSKEEVIVSRQTYKSLIAFYELTPKIYPVVQ